MKFTYKSIAFSFVIMFTGNVFGAATGLPAELTQLSIDVTAGNVDAKLRRFANIIRAIPQDHQFSTEDANILLHEAAALIKATLTLSISETNLQDKKIKLNGWIIDPLNTFTRMQIYNATNGNSPIWFQRQFQLIQHTTFAKIQFEQNCWPARERDDKLRSHRTFEFDEAPIIWPLCPPVPNYPTCSSSTAFEENEQATGISPEHELPETQLVRPEDEEALSPEYENAND
ncbi:hypothetical protein K2X40_00750 [Candidatus Babeliales bacterium]|nr:hypothetical protein [Candidatus Babeliales bacterium]